VPFDEGTLAGALSMTSTWPEGDWRNTYFGPENLGPSVAHLEELAADVGGRMPLPELALRFILANPAVSTVIPGMRTPDHVRSNIGVSDGRRLDGDTLAGLRRHRWDRLPAPWSG
jgi:aryl-alcohol dehydrogenase-like predicted oxidoreductase